MGTKNNPGEFDCYGKLDPDEPYFVLMGRDKAAPALVWLWASLRALHMADVMTKTEEAKINEAHTVSRDMFVYQVNAGKETIGVGQAALIAVMELIRAANTNTEQLLRTVVPNAPTGNDFFRLLLAQTQFKATEAEVRPASDEDWPEGTQTDSQHCARHSMGDKLIAARQANRDAARDDARPEETQADTVRGYAGPLEPPPASNPDADPAEEVAFEKVFGGRNYEWAMNGSDGRYEGALKEGWMARARIADTSHDYRQLLTNLVDQICRSDFQDGMGHRAKDNMCYQAARRAIYGPAA